jgi:hypothetical protein
MQLRSRLALAFLAMLILSGCSEEDAAKAASWMGTKSINESKADIFSAAALRKASSSRHLRAVVKQFTECMESAVGDAKSADTLYARDCEFGNTRACRKRAEFHTKWDEQSE